LTSICGVGVKTGLIDPLILELETQIPCWQPSIRIADLPETAREFTVENEYPMRVAWIRKRTGPVSGPYDDEGRTDAGNDATQRRDPAENRARKGDRRVIQVGHRGGVPF
jgi:hypothetical protein